MIQAKTEVKVGDQIKTKFSMFGGGPSRITKVADIRVNGQGTTLFVTADGAWLGREEFDLYR